MKTTMNQKIEAALVQIVAIITADHGELLGDLVIKTGLSARIVEKALALGWTRRIIAFVHEKDAGKLAADLGVYTPIPAKWATKYDAQARYGWHLDLAYVQRVNARRGMRALFDIGLGLDAACGTAKWKNAKAGSTALHNIGAAFASIPAVVWSADFIDGSFRRFALLEAY